MEFHGLFEREHYCDVLCLRDHFKDNDIKCLPEKFDAPPANNQSSVVPVPVPVEDFFSKDECKL